MVGALLLLLASAARPASGYSAPYTACMASGDAAAGVTSAMMDCTGAELGRQDDRLNQVYRERIAAVAPPRAAALRTAERAWIKARDARCHRVAKAEEDGSLGGLVYAGCILDATIARTRWLEAYR